MLRLHLGHLRQRACCTAPGHKVNAWQLMQLPGGQGNATQQLVQLLRAAGGALGGGKSLATDALGGPPVVGEIGLIQPRTVSS